MRPKTNYTHLRNCSRNRIESNARLSRPLLAHYSLGQATDLHGRRPYRIFCPALEPQGLKSISLFTSTICILQARGQDKLWTIKASYLVGSLSVYKPKLSFNLWEIKLYSLCLRKISLKDAFNIFPDTHTHTRKGPSKYVNSCHN